MVLSAVRSWSALRRQPGNALRGSLPGSPAAGLTLSNVTIAYGARVAVENISGAFAPGSLTAVVGPNGGGKSSLLKAIAGIHRIRGGAIDGRPADRRDLAYLPQLAVVDQDFPITVSELVTLGGWRAFGAYRRPPPELVSRIEEAIAAVGIGDLAQQPVADLSPGQFRRALFARLVVQDAAALLLDEPFAAVDEQTTNDLLGLVQRWHHAGKTIVVVLHDLAQVRRHFPSTLVLARFAVAWGGTADTLSEDNLAKAAAILSDRNRPSRLAP